MPFISGNHERGTGFCGVSTMSQVPSRALAIASALTGTVQRLPFST